MRLCWLLLVAGIAGGLAACAADRATMSAIGAPAGLERVELHGGGFTLFGLRRRGAGAGVDVEERRAPGRSRLHVYIGGDGRPWLAGDRVAADPTPRQPPVLAIMRRDPNQALYLGRPCYHGGSTTPPCRPWLWTHGRYSETVVAAMADALGRHALEQGVDEITLIGYSGGGVLAMLLAERVARVRAVVTVAANLDVAAWTRLHGYSMLEDSLNPAERPALPEHIRQVHFAGARDRQVPPWLVRQGLRNQPAALVHVVEGADHGCCWPRLWPSLLDYASTSRP